MRHLHWGIVRKFLSGVMDHSSVSNPTHPSRQSLIMPSFPYFHPTSPEGDAEACTRKADASPSPAVMPHQTSSMPIGLSSGLKPATKKPPCAITRRGAERLTAGYAPASSLSSCINDKSCADCSESSRRASADSSTLCAVSMAIRLISSMD